MIDVTFFISRVLAISTMIVYFIMGMYPENTEYNYNIITI